MKNRPDSSGWMTVLGEDWLFAEYIAKKGRHCGAVSH